MVRRLKASKRMLWNIAAGGLSLACVVLLAIIWLSGAADTRDAFESGRRVLISVEDGSVKGKLLTAKTQPPPETTPAPAAPEVPAAAETPPAETAPAPAPETPPAAAPEPAAATPETPPPAPEPAAENAPPPQDMAAATATPTPDAAPEAPVAAAPVNPVEVEEAQAEPDMTQMAEEEAPTIIPSDHPLPDTSSKLIEKSTAGDLPVIGADGIKPWTYYAKPSSRQGNQPMIAIIITGIGQNKKVAEKTMALPENFTLSLAPYAKNVASWASSARLTAHEKLVDLPMEPSNYPAADPGPHGLIIDKGAKENELRLQWVLSRFTGYIGVVTPQDEVFSGNNEAFRLLLQSLSNRGIFLVMGREPAKTDTKDVIEASNIPHVIADMLIDEEFTASSMQTRLVALEQLAKKRGYAVGIAQATPLSIEQLRSWYESLAEKGILLVPVSAIAKLRFS